MTWSSFHRRADVLRAVVAAAETRRDGVLPLDVPGAATGAGAVFADRRDLVGALQLTWLTRLMGRIESHQARSDTPRRSLEDAVIAAWQEVYADLGGVRLVLDAARESADPDVRVAMARASEKEHLTLAAAAGLGPVGGWTDPAAVRVGARIEQRARESARTPVATVVVPDAPRDSDHSGGAGDSDGPGVFDRVWERLRARLAA